MTKQKFFLSEAIRAARRRAGLSQAELAELLGVRQSSVSQWERGSTKPSTIHLLALTAALKCSLMDFTGADAGDVDGTGDAGIDAGDTGEQREARQRAREGVP